MLIRVSTFLYLAENGLLRSLWGFCTVGGLIQLEDVGGLYLIVKEIVKFDMSNASPLSEQSVVLLSSF